MKHYYGDLTQSFDIIKAENDTLLTSRLFDMIIIEKGEKAENTQV